MRHQQSTFKSKCRKHKREISSVIRLQFHKRLYNQQLSHQQDLGTKAIDIIIYEDSNQCINAVLNIHSGQVCILFKEKRPLAINRLVALDLVKTEVYKLFMGTFTILN